MEEPQDHRSPVALAAAWASQVTGIGLEMAVPPVLGLWIDRKLGTGFAFTTLGAILGLYVALRNLLRLAQVAQGRRSHHGGKDHAPHDDQDDR